MRSEGKRTNVRTVAIVPMNRLSLAKSRLASALDPEGRRQLALWMGERVLRAIRESDLVERSAVVSPDPEVMTWARERDIEALSQSEGDLNAGLELGRQWSIAQAADALLVLFGDLPLLAAADVRSLIEAVRSRDTPAAVALAPDRADTGTNALALRPPGALPFLFGAESFSRHIEAARQFGLDVRVIRRIGTSFDVDTPGDLDELQAQRLWTPEVRHATLSTPGGGR